MKKKIIVLIISLVLILSGCSLLHSDNKCACGEPVEKVDTKDS